MTISKQPLTNNAWGKRTTDPVALTCIHITGNSRTAAYTDLHAAAQAERNYANRAGSRGPSAHLYVARDGWAIQAINPELYWAWSNGDFYTLRADGTKRWNNANLANPGIQRVFDLTKRGFNANQGYWLEIEAIGYGSSYPITDAQKQFCAERIATMARNKNMPVNRATVHGHWEINAIDRWNCPSPNHESFLNDIIARANKILNTEETELLTLTDRTPKIVTLTTGARLYDPVSGIFVVAASNASAGRPSPFATAVGRVIQISTGGIWTLLAAKENDPLVTITDPPPDTALTDLQAQLALREAEDNQIATQLHELANQLAS